MFSIKIYDDSFTIMYYTFQGIVIDIACFSVLKSIPFTVGLRRD